MDYIGSIIRPPSEAFSIILQVTVGCSHNRCTFCGAYKEKLFAIKEPEIISSDLSFAAKYCREQHKVFLADGDALIIPFPRLLAIFKEIRSALPWVRRISLYGSARSIRSKTPEQLKQLKALGLDRVYLGLESGDDSILKAVEKNETAASMIEAAQQIAEAGAFLSVTVLLGLAQRVGSLQHAVQTAAVINRMRPQQVAALTLMPLANTAIGIQADSGLFELPSPIEILEELKNLVEHIAVPTQLHANHASNYLPIAGRLPRDQQKLLRLIAQAQDGERQLVPESLRRL